jgi:hypothetical protein
VQRWHRPPGTEVPVVLFEDPAVDARTDQDRRIPLFVAREAPRSPFAWEEEGLGALRVPWVSETEETGLLKQRAYLPVVSRTAPSDPGYNSHGWVFAEGRGHLRGESVEAILRDNGYRQVEKPESKDLIVFRSDQGQILHTGIVNAVGEHVLIESKWGTGGRFRYKPDEQPFGKRYAFYRSERQQERGHTLRGLSRNGPVP